MDCWQVWGGAFTPKSPFEVQKNQFIYVKRAKDKNIAKLFIGVPRVRNWQCKQFHARLYPCTATPKGVTKNELFFMLKGPKLKTVSYRTLGFPEYGMINASNVKRGFTPDSNRKRGNTKMVNKIDINLCKSAEAKQIQKNDQDDEGGGRGGI